MRAKQAAPASRGRLPRRLAPAASPRGPRLPRTGCYYYSSIQSVCVNLSTLR